MESFGFAFILTYPVPTLPVDTITWPFSYDCADCAESPSEPVSCVPGNEPLYPRTTYNLPIKFLSLDGTSLEALWT